MQIERLRTGRTIYHLHFKDGGHHYFGGIAAIFELFDSLTIGATAQSLYDYDINEDKPYKNKICTIRKGYLIRKAGNRKPPVTK